MSDQHLGTPRPSLQALFRGEASLAASRRSPGMVDQPAPPSTVVRNLQLALAVCTWADPIQLLGGKGTDEERSRALEMVGPLCDLGIGDHAGQWSMRSSARHQVVAQADASQAIEALAGAPQNDGVAQSLRYLMAVEQTSLDHFSSRELATLREVQAWARPWVSHFVSDDELRRRIARKLLDDDFREQLPVGLVGHDGELAQLLSYLRAASAMEASPGRRLFFLHGPGGVGKSSLIAELGRRVLEKDPAALIAILDFDRADLDPLRAATLDFDFLNQLATADNAAAAALTQVIDDIRWQRSPDDAVTADEDELEDPSDPRMQSGVGLESADAVGKSVTMGSAGLYGLTHGVTGRPVILILDTFERVEEAGLTAVESVVRWLSTLTALHGIDDLRLLASGRNDPGEAPPGQWHSLQVEPVPVGPLNRDESRRLFERLAAKSPAGDRLSDPRLLDSMVEISQGIPLIVRLIVGLLDRLDESDVEDILNRGGGVPAEVVQGILYDRTLKHIPDKRAQNYAHPGLVLPRLDVDLIRKVLAPIVEPGRTLSIAEAEAIFRGLKEPRWLTRVSQDGRSLRQRPDLRALLLRLMASDPKRAAEVAHVRERARDYHRRGRGTRHGAYQIYYDLLAARTRDDLEVFEGVVLKPYLPILRDHLTDLPPIAQDLVQAEQGRHLALAEAARSLPNGAWARYLAGAAGVRGEGERIVERADPMLVLPVWRERPTGERGRPPTFVIQALAETAEWRGDELHVQAVVSELKDTLARRPAVWRHLLKRLYWLTRYALLAEPGPLTDEHASLLRDVLNQSSPSQPLSALPSLAAVADAFGDRRNPILVDAERWLASPKVAAVPRMRLVLGGLGNANAVRDFRMPSSRDVHVFQADWPDRIAVLAPGLSTALGPAVESFRNMTERPSIASLEAWSKKAGKISLDVASVDPKSRDAILLLLGPWIEFYRPARQALREAFATVDDIRGLIATIRSDFTIWPSDFEGDRFIDLLERDPVAWFFALVRFADQARMLDRLLADAARLAPHSKLPMVLQHFRAWDAALTSGTGSRWWPNEAVIPPSPSIVRPPEHSTIAVSPTTQGRREPMPRRDSERLKKYLEMITRNSGGIERVLAEWPPGAQPAGLESVAMDRLEGMGTAAATNLARAGLEKVALGLTPTEAEQTGLEAIILPDLRPVVDIVDGRFQMVHPLWRRLSQDGTLRARIEGTFPSIGRIELPGHPKYPYGGTGFVVGNGLIMTNRHVAEIFTDGVGERRLSFVTGVSAGIDFLQERDRPTGPTLVVRKVVMIHPYWDMAILAVDNLPANRRPLRLSLTDARDLTGHEIFVVGYPAFDPRNPADVQQKIMSGLYGIKRLQPGELQTGKRTASFGKLVLAATHDCSTLGGNSGSAVIDLATGSVFGLHFGGRYQEQNFAVPASELGRDSRVIDTGVMFDGTPSGGANEWSDSWRDADAMESGAASAINVQSPEPSSPPIRAVATMANVTQGSIRLEVPVVITISLGAPVLATARVETVEVPSRELAAEGLEGLVEPHHDGRYGNREGYDPSFLNPGDEDTDAFDVPMPGVVDPDVLARTEAGADVLPYQNFSIKMHAKRRLALVAASNVTKERKLRKPDPDEDYTRRGLSGLETNDQERWFIDPRLDPRFQLPDVFFTKDRKAFDKGHIVRRDDIAWGKSYAALRRANGDSYHVTNCSPQVEGFNRSGRGVENWGDLENHVLSEAASERLCVFAGPVLDDEDRVFVGKGDGGSVLRAKIPSRFWKVIVARVEDGVATYAFMLEQDLSSVEWEFAVAPEFIASMYPLADIEAATGIRFDQKLHDADHFDLARGAEIALRSGTRRKRRRAPG